MSDTLLIRCRSCGSNNRVPQEKIERGLEAICGNCKTPLPVVHEPITVTDATFQAEVESSPLPVLVDMWAPWCPPCKLIAPVIDQLAAEMAGRVRFAKLNVDENPRTTQRFNPMAIPTLVVLKQGQEIDRMLGVQSKQAIARRLELVIARARAASPATAPQQPGD